MLWYRVQIGAYLLKKSAENVCADLIEKGFKTAMPKENGLYKVRIGSFRDESKAKKCLAEVKKYGKYKNAKIMLYDDGKDTAPASDQSDYHPNFKFVGIWLTESCESKYGDAQVFIEYAEDGSIAHAILVDTGQNGTDTVKKLKKLGITFLDAVVISHGHGDHYGYLTTILDAFTVYHLYLPNMDDVKKYQPSYAKAIQNQEKKAKKRNIPVTYLKEGSFFAIGKIRCDVVFQCKASELSEHDNHKFINNMSIATLFTLDGVGRVLLTGDLSNPGNKVFMKRISKIIVDIAKCGWHGDGNAMTEAFAKWVSAVVWYWNYHHKESRGGRGNTRKKLEAAGCKHVLRNYEDGDLIFAFHDGTWSVNTSKSKQAFVFKARMAA